MQLRFTQSSIPFANVAWPMLLVVAAILQTLLLLIAMQYSSGWIVLAVGVAIVGLCISAYYPSFLVAATVFLLFSNVPVVAVRFHGVPKIAATLGPPLALLLVWAYQLIRHRQRVVIPRAWPWAIGLLMVESISAMFGRYPAEAREMLQGHLIEGLGLFLILVQVVQTRTYLKHAVLALLLAGCWMGGLSLWQQVTGTHRNDYGGFAQVPMEGKGFAVGKQRQRRSAGPLGEQNRYAQNMLMLIPLAALPLATRGYPRKAAYSAGMALISAGCLLTFSRGALVAGMLLAIMMAMCGYVRARQLVMLSFFALLLIPFFPQVTSRMESVGTLLGYVRGEKAAYAEELDGAITGRATSMMAALRVTADYPVLGVGPGNFPLYNREYAKIGGFRAHQEDRAAHCLYLHLSAEVGLLGLSFFLLMAGVTIVGLHRIWKKHRDSDLEMAVMAAGFGSAIVAYLLSGIFLHYSFIRFFWIVLALANSVIVIDRSSASVEGAAP